MTSVEKSGEFSIHPDDLTVSTLSYMFPEVRTVLGGLALDPGFYRSTIKPTEATDTLREGGYDFTPELALPTTKQGYLDFDELHAPITARITDYYKAHLPGLTGFENRYATQGSTEAIRILIPYWFATGKMTELATLSGDYIGYRSTANDFGVPTHTVESLEDAGDPVEGRIWFISNPSAIDGNWQDDETLQAFIEADHQVVIDYAYGGLTVEPHELDVSAPNIVAVLTSPSKIFGVFDLRYTGVAYVREPVNPLEATNPWFRSAPAMLDTLMLYESFEPHELAKKHHNTQVQICQTLGRIIGEEVRPSDAILLANTVGPLPPEFNILPIKPDMYHLRLSKLFELFEQQTSK